MRNRDLANYLSSALLKKCNKLLIVDFKNNALIKIDIIAKLGQPVNSRCEKFIPFIVEEFKCL